MKTRKSIKKFKKEFSNLSDDIKNFSKIQKVIKSSVKVKEEPLIVSYRDVHCIGKRKSNDKVVTYSLNSHMFFDVYAKFGHDNFGFSKTDNKLSRGLIKKETVKSNYTEDVHIKESRSHIITTKVSNKHLQNVSRTNAPPLTFADSLQKDKVSTERSVSPPNKQGGILRRCKIEKVLPNEVKLCYMDRMNISNDVSPEKSSLEDAKLYTSVTEDDSTDDSLSPFIDHRTRLNKSTGSPLRSSLGLRSRDIDTLRSPLSEDLSTDECHSFRSSSKRMRVMYEVHPVDFEESIISSPPLDKASPFKSPNQALLSISKNISFQKDNLGHMNMPATNTETFHRLLENKTVFKKHLSKVPLLNVTNNKLKQSESRKMSTNVKQFSEDTSRDIKEISDGYKSQNHDHQLQPNNRKKTKIKNSVGRKNMPLREKRVASLNAAAIINCVQFDNVRKTRTNEKYLMEKDKNHFDLKHVEVKNESIITTECVQEIINETNGKEMHTILTRSLDKNKDKHYKLSEQRRKKDERKIITGIKNYNLKSNKKYNGISADIIMEPLTKVDGMIVDSVKNSVKFKNVKEKNINRKHSLNQNTGKNRTSENLRGIWHEKNIPQIIKSSIKKDNLLSTVLLKRNRRKKNNLEGKNKTVFKSRIKLTVGNKDQWKRCSKVLETKNIADSSWQWEGDGHEQSISLQGGTDLVSRTCYSAIRHAKDNLVIRVMDCVILRSVDDQEPYLAKIVALFFDENTGRKMMVLMWYYRPEHTAVGRQSWHSKNDVYASKHTDTNSVECIEDKAFVLPIELYSRFRAYDKREGENSRQSLATRIVPYLTNDVDSIDLKAPQRPSSEVNMEMFASDFYYNLNFQTTFLPEMTASNVFVCRGIYDIRSETILDDMVWSTESCAKDNLDTGRPTSAIYLSTSESRHKALNSYFDISSPPNITMADVSQEVFSPDNDLSPPLLTFSYFSEKSLSPQSPPVI